MKNVLYIHNIVYYTDIDEIILDSLKTSIHIIYHGWLIIIILDNIL